MYECLFACMSVHHCVWCPWSSEEGVGCPRTEITGDCELVCGCWDSNLEELLMLLTLGPSLQFPPVPLIGRTLVIISWPHVPLSVWTVWIQVYVSVFLGSNLRSISCRLSTLKLVNDFLELQFFYSLDEG